MSATKSTVSKPLSAPTVRRLPPGEYKLGLYQDPEGDGKPNATIKEWTAKLGLVAAGLGVTLVPGLAAAAVRPDVALVRIINA